MRKLMLAMIVFAASIFVGTATISAQVNDSDLEQRVFNLGILRAGKSNAAKKTKQGDPKKILAQVQDDFTQIQVINNEFMEALQRTGSLELGAVVKSMSEINKRAVRLMESLTETKLKDNKPPEPLSDETKLKDSLYQLDTVVGDFSHNPVFKAASPDDEKLAAKALRDLDEIIALSQRIVISGQHLQKCHNGVKDCRN